MSSKSLVRMERKMDALLVRMRAMQERVALLMELVLKTDSDKKVTALPPKQFSFDVPLHQIEQVCPLCGSKVEWSYIDDGPVYGCNCRLPA